MLSWKTQHLSEKACYLKNLALALKKNTCFAQVDFLPAKIGTLFFRLSKTHRMVLMLQLRVSQAFGLLERNHLAFQLSPFSVRELLFVTDLPCDVFALEKGVFKLALRRRSFINKDIIKALMAQGIFELFILFSAHLILIEY